MPWFWSTPAASAHDEPPSPSPTGVLSRFLTPDVVLPTILLTGTILGSARVYRTRLRRLPTAVSIPNTFLRTRSIWGRVTSVGDADNFRVYHTPGGVFAGWGWARRVPSSRAALREQTVHVRVAGIDAPEAAHFGRPAQPYAGEALAQLKDLVDGRHVRVWLYRKDQYERVVGLVRVRRWGLPGLPPALMRDVGYNMIRSGAATVYEARVGAEFGGVANEAKYRAAEQKAKREKRGMWGGARSKGVWDGMLKAVGLRKKAEEAVESPREYKTRIKKLEEGKGEQIPPSGSGKKA